MYHFAAAEQGQSVRLSEDYFIEAQEDQAPKVHIMHPGATPRSVRSRKSPFRCRPTTISRSKEWTCIIR